MYHLSAGPMTVTPCPQQFPSTPPPQTAAGTSNPQHRHHQNSNHPKRPPKVHRSAVSVMSSGKPQQSEDLQTCGLVARPLCRASCLGLCTTTTVARCRTCGGCHWWRMSADTPLTALCRASVPRVRTMNGHGCVRDSVSVCARVRYMCMCRASLRLGCPGSAQACIP